MAGKFHSRLFFGTWILSGILCLSIFESLTLANGPNRSPWENECLNLEKKQACSASANPNALQALDIHQQMIQSQAGQQQLEKEFLYNFLSDQFQQTQCKKSLLAPFDLVPDDGTLCDDGSLHDQNLATAVSLCKANPDNPICGSSPVKKRPVSQVALYRQNKILDQIWKLHSVLLTETDECKRWKDRLETDDQPTVVSKNYQHIRVQSTVDEDTKQKTFHCGEKQAITSKIWSGTTPEMQTFLNSWLDRFRQSNYTEDQFRALAIPVGPDNMIKEANSDVTLEGAIWKMSCAAKKRDKILYGAIKTDANGNVITDAQGHPIPRDGMNDPLNTTNSFTDSSQVYHPSGRQVFDALFGDGGQAADGYLANSKYKGISDALSCHLKKEYNSEPNHSKAVKIAEGVGVTVAGIGASFVVGPEAAAYGIAVASGIYESYNGCKKSFKPGTLEVANVCDQIKGHENDAGFVTSAIDSGESCAAAIESSVLNVAFAGLGGPEEAEAKNIASLLEDKTIATQVKSGIKKSAETQATQSGENQLGAAARRSGGTSIQSGVREAAQSTLPKVDPKRVELLFPKEHPINQEALDTLLKTKSVQSYTNELNALGPKLVDTQKHILAEQASIEEEKASLHSLDQAIQKESESGGNPTLKAAYEKQRISKQAQLDAHQKIFQADFDQAHLLAAKVEETNVLREMKSLYDSGSIEIEQIYETGRDANIYARKTKFPPHDEDVVAFRIKLKKPLELCRQYSSESAALGTGNFWGGCAAKNYVSGGLADALQAVTPNNAATDTSVKHFARQQFKEGDEFIVSGIGKQTDKAYGTQALGGTMQFQRVNPILYPSDETLAKSGKTLADLRAKLNRDLLIRDVVAPKSDSQEVLNFQRNFRTFTSDATPVVDAAGNKVTLQQSRDEVIQSLQQQIDQKKAELSQLKPADQSGNSYSQIEASRIHDNKVKALQNAIRDYSEDQITVTREAEELQKRADLIAQGETPSNAYIRANRASVNAQTALEKEINMRMKAGQAPLTPEEANQIYESNFIVPDHVNVNLSNSAETPGALKLPAAAPANP